MIRSDVFPHPSMRNERASGYVISERAAFACVGKPKSAAPIRTSATVYTTRTEPGQEDNNEKQNKVRTPIAIKEQKEPLPRALSRGGRNHQAVGRASALRNRLEDVQTDGQKRTE